MLRLLLLITGILLIVVVTETVLLIQSPNISYSQGQSSLQNQSTDGVVYSNGWYGYSVVYPSGAYIRYGGNEFGGGARRVETVDFREIPVGQHGSYPCYITTLHQGEKSNHNGDSVIPDSAEVKTSTYNGLLWKKYSYHESTGNVLYDYSAIKWQVENDSFIFIVFADPHTEKFCESIVKSFTFSVNKASSSGTEAENVRRIATDYAKKNFPSNIYWEGWFYNKDDKNNLTYNVEDVTTNAFVEFVNPANRKYTENRWVKMHKENSEWVVESVVNYPYDSL